MTDIAALESRLGVKFRDQEALRAALIHGSYINESGLPEYASNERLEFLGDAVLSLVVAQWLYEREPTVDEGRLTRLRSLLVRRETLVRVAQELELGQYLIMGRGEEQAGGRDREANLANTVEAIIGAIYLDQSLQVAGEVVRRLLEPVLDEWGADGESRDTKSLLQEVVQAQRKVQPVYTLLSVEGPAHDQVFTVEVRVDEEMLGQGQGKSKRAAEMDAARKALETLEVKLA